MQIQRIQTLWLILALASMVAFIAMPFGTLDVPGVGVTPLRPYDFTGLIIPAGLAALFMLLAIAGFKNLSTQRSETVLALMMTLVTVGIAVYVLCDRATIGVIEWGWSPALLAVALVLCVLAIFGINHDMKLLRSYDRLR